MTYTSSHALDDRAVEQVVTERGPSYDVGIACVRDDHGIGYLVVTKILEHHPQGEGDRWFYDLYLDNGQVVRMFNVVQVVYEAPLQ